MSLFSENNGVFHKTLVTTNRIFQFVRTCSTTEIPAVEETKKLMIYSRLLVTSKNAVCAAHKFEPIDHKPCQESWKPSLAKFEVSRMKSVSLLRVTQQCGNLASREQHKTPSKMLSGSAWPFVLATPTDVL